MVELVSAVIGVVTVLSLAGIALAFYGAYLKGVVSTLTHPKVTDHRAVEQHRAQRVRDEESRNTTVAIRDERTVPGYDNRDNSDDGDDGNA